MTKSSGQKIKKQTNIIIVLVFLAVPIFLLAIIPESILQRIQEIIIFRGRPADCKRCPGLFSDGVATQAKAYYREGIQPREKFSELLELERKGILVRIKNGKKYYLASMTHSVPLLVSKAAGFLDLLAHYYEAECKKRGLKYRSFKITSMTRSLESVRDLQEKNSVAIRNSAHLYGKTMDISYTSFRGYQKELDAFVTALSNLRTENKCYVKYEASTGCLHITVR